MGALLSAIIQLGLSLNLFPSQPAQEIAEQVNKPNFEKLLRSKTFYTTCKSYNHPIFKSLKYSIRYDEGDKFREDLYLFSKDSCKGSLTLLESEGKYLLGKSIEGEIPTREIDYQFNNVNLKVFNQSIRKKLANLYHENNCEINPNRLFDHFSLKEKTCFGLDFRKTQEVESDLLGLSTNKTGSELYLFGGLQNSEKPMRPTSLNFEEKLL